MSKITVHPFTPRPHCPACNGDRVSRQHYAGHSVLLTTCTTCGHRGAQEMANTSRDMALRPRTIVLPDDDENGAPEAADDDGVAE